MKSISGIVLGLFATGLPAAEPADIVLTNGAVYTVDAARSWAEAVAINGDLITFVGSDDDVQAHVGPDTRVVELDGRMLLPGFQDSHIHPISASLKSSMCNLRSLGSVAAYLEEIERCVETYADSDWIHGAGWAHSIFPADAAPTSRMLDEIAPDVPVTLSSYDGHSLWANSKAMQAAGISASTPDVVAGEIVRYPGSRQPTGLFLEDEAQSLVLAAQPPYPETVVYDALISVQSYLNSIGITSIQDAFVDLADGGQYSVMPTYRRAAEKGELTLRVVAAMYWEPTRGMEQVAEFVAARAANSVGLLRPAAIKIWYDGVMHTRTSKLIEPYADTEAETGMSMVTPQRLAELSIALDKEGFQLHFHADGDLAIRECLDAIEAAIATNGRSQNRHHIAHLELIHPDDIPRFRQLGVIANVQPMWSTYPPYITDLVDNKIGPERSRWLQINQSFLDHGVTVAYGSDWFVTSPNPMDLIEAAVTRIRPMLPLQTKRDSEPPLPGENVRLADAIASYTINGAYLNHQEKETGSIEVGKFADLVVLDRNLFETEPVRISETKVLLTLMAGKPVHGRLRLE